MNLLLLYRIKCLPKNINYPSYPSTSLASCFISALANVTEFAKQSANRYNAQLSWR